MSNEREQNTPEILEQARTVEMLIVAVREQRLIGLRTKRKSDGKMITMLCAAYFDESGHLSVSAFGEVLFGNVIEAYENPQEYMTETDVAVCSMLAHGMGYEHVGNMVADMLIKTHEGNDNDQTKQ